MKYVEWKYCALCRLRDKCFWSDYAEQYSKTGWTVPKTYCPWQGGKLMPKNK